MKNRLGLRSKGRAVVQELEANHYRLSTTEAVREEKVGSSGIRDGEVTV